MCSGDDSFLEKKEPAPRKPEETNSTEDAESIRVGGPLSPIPEESEHTEDEFFVNSEVAPQYVREANRCANLYASDLNSDIDPATPELYTYCKPYSEDVGVSLDYAFYVPSHYADLKSNLENKLPLSTGLLKEEPEFEIYYENQMHKLLALSNEDQEIVPTNSFYIEHVFKASKHKNKSNKKKVVDRADHELTSDEIKSHWPEVMSAIKKELETWLKYNCISRKARQSSRNIIDCRWVHKWKLDADTQDAASMAEAVKKWVIRARLCLRGFKDIQASQLESYAGTALRFSQRLVVSEAVLRGWDIGTTDISKAFLQGVTYKELAEATGEPLREVNFDLPAYCVPILRQLPGWENFDPRVEVIHCDKPGTGCVDAPRCFSIKLARITNQVCGMKPCSVDSELCFLHDAPGKLSVILAKHVDDIKITGVRERVLAVLKELEKAFGQLKIEWNNFTNCGIRHAQDVKTKTVFLDQEDYIKGIKLVVHTLVQTKGGSEQVCDQALKEQYWSVLGALAFATITRPDIAVFVAALQRVTHAPLIIHCKRLNAVIRWAQRNAKKIIYSRFGGDIQSVPSSHLRMISDAAFKKEEDDGHSMRGAIYMRCLGNTAADFVKTAPGHLIEFVSRQQRRVTRATFTSELQGGCDTVDKGILLLQILDEMSSGRSSASDALARRERGGWAVPGALYLDAMSVFAAVTATFIKIPADNGVLVHCLYLRELLDFRVLEYLIWLDTRDMTADGLTKGAVDRLALHDAMQGGIKFLHEAKSWCPKIRRQSST